MLPAATCCTSCTTRCCNNWGSHWVASEANALDTLIKPEQTKLRVHRRRHRDCLQLIFNQLCPWLRLSAWSSRVCSKNWHSIWPASPSAFGLVANSWQYVAKSHLSQPPLMPAVGLRLCQLFGYCSFCHTHTHTGHTYTVAYLHYATYCKLFAAAIAFAFANNQTTKLNLQQKAIAMARK